ncbi:MAG: putative nucleic acid-binding protein [Arenicella sp.]|jgi:predicted nucleic acid-binding protein
MIILDTNIVSELMKSEPDKGVIKWFEILEDQPVMLTVISVAELRYGVSALPDGERKNQLDEAITDMINEDFEDCILDFNLASAEAYGILLAKLRSEGITTSQSDAMIASIALINEAQLVTRNIRDFKHCGVSLINPFSA